MKKCSIRFEDIGINEILYVINKLNDEIYKKCKHEGDLYRPLSFECDGYSSYPYYNRAWIKFMDVTIWDTEENDRKFYESLNRYESIEDYLRREINRITKLISKIKM